MRWLLLAAVLCSPTILVLGCAGNTQKDPDPDKGDGDPLGGDENTSDGELCSDAVEISFLQFGKRGDKKMGKQEDIYLLLYTDGWKKYGTYGGPFQKLAKDGSVSTSFKDLKKAAYQELYAYMYGQGFFELPGTNLVDWQRFKQPGYWTKVLSIDRAGDRHIVFEEDVRGDGNDPRWNKFLACQREVIDTFSKIEQVGATVKKDSFNEALNAWMKRNR